MSVMQKIKDIEDEVRQHVHSLGSYSAASLELTTLAISYVTDG